MFCLRFFGNLAATVGPTVCLEEGECVDVGRLVEELLRSRGEALSLEEVLVTLPDGSPLPPGTTTCDTSEIRVLRLLRGG